MILSAINKYLGWRNWAVLQYNSIFENLFVVFYIALRQQNDSVSFLIDLLLFGLFSMFSTTYGYLVNDYADIDLDREHGKQNTFSADKKPKALFVVILFLVLSVACSVPFLEQDYFLALWFSWLIISSGYSLRPLRLKERGKTGLVFVVLAQRLVPILLLFSAFNFSYLAELIILSVYVFFRGLSSDINHQVDDYENDLKTATNTSAVQMGRSWGQKILRLSLEAEKLLLATILVLFVTILWSADVFVNTWVITLAALYLVFYLFSFYLLLTKKGTLDVNPFHPSQKNIFQFLHHSYPSVILAIGLNIPLIAANLYFILPFIGQLFIRRVFSPKLIKDSFVFDIIKKTFRMGVR